MHNSLCVSVRQWGGVGEGAAISSRLLNYYNTEYDDDAALHGWVYTQAQRRLTMVCVKWTDRHRHCFIILFVLWNRLQQTALSVISSDLHTDWNVTGDKHTGVCVCAFVSFTLKRGKVYVSPVVAGGDATALFQPVQVGVPVRRHAYNSTDTTEHRMKHPFCFKDPLLIYWKRVRVIRVVSYYDYAF